MNYIRKWINNLLFDNDKVIAVQPAIARTSIVQLPQTKFVGKIKKPTALIVQQRQRIKQTKKVITTCPQDLRFVKKPVTSVTPQQPAVVLQTSTPVTCVVEKPHVSKITRDFYKNSITEPLSNSLESDDELRCPICAELFIEAMTLSCSHTYCTDCIRQWRKVRQVCPLCNRRMSKEYPTRVIDKCIEKVLQKAGEEEIERRRQQIAQRLNATSSNEKKRQ